MAVTYPDNTPIETIADAVGPSGILIFHLGVRVWPVVVVLARHDARWFMAVAQHFGIEAASRLNQIRMPEEMGRVEMKRLHESFSPITAKRYGRIPQLQRKQPSHSMAPDLIEYEIKILDHQSYEMRLKEMLCL